MNSNRSRRTRGALLLGIFVGLFLAGCDGFGTDPENDVDNNDFVASEAFSIDVPVANQQRLRLQAINGTVAIIGSSTASSVHVTGVRKVGSDSQRDAERHLAQLEVQVQDQASEVYVRTDQPNNSYGRSYIVNYTITLPENLNVVIDHVNGSVQLSDMIGAVDVDLVNGDITCDGDDPPQGDISLGLVNGNINLGVSSAMSATFTAQVTNGLISVSKLALDDYVSTPRSMSGRLGSGDLSVQLAVVNGIITVTGHP